MKMASKSASLRLIKTSGGLFTESILLRLRDNPKRINIGRIESFLEKDTPQLRVRFKTTRNEIFKWCCDTWDDVSANINKFSYDELIEKWLIPLFSQFGYELEEFELKKKDIDEDDPLKNFKISHQSKGHVNPFFQFVGENENFKDKIKTNPQSHPHHNICQQFINLNPEFKWLFLSNGRLLRILTKYYHTYSTGYVQFDLENIFSNRDKKEFNTLYAIIHQSRFVETPKEKAYLIELFQKQSASEGVKIGDSLRYSVEKAIQLLGNSLIQQNPEFLDEILEMRGDLSEFLSEFYAELLRIIYRIIFILYAEKRKMLPVDKGIYLEHFSLSSMRKLAEKQLSVEKSRDLWEKLFTTFKLIKKGNYLLEVNSFNGSLFKNKILPIIKGKNLSITNDILIRIIRLITTFKDANIRQKINFSIKEEEIGSIYESLLDFRPHLTSNKEFKLISQTAERKSTGSYYTPRSLIDILIRTTLQPLVEDRLKEAGNDIEKRTQAILDLKVCDPACGGGTFLLSAMDFLGKKLAEIKAGISNPLKDDLRKARREVLQHCIYGVDKNPLAVELAKISLWLRACVKDKPLNFLDNHIRCGNSLIGLGQKIEINEINPNAFEAISGNKATGIEPENKRLRSKAREIIIKEIKERYQQGKPTLITSFFTERVTADICSAKFQEIVDLPEIDSDNIDQKEKMYNKLRKNEKYQQALNEANIWVSTFFWPFESEVQGEIPRFTTIEQLREKIQDPELKKLMKKITKITNDNQFFHWYIEFPEVFSSERGGFDCILTNPPWETLDLREMEFFISEKEIKNAPKQSKRRSLIKNLKSSKPLLYENYKDAFVKIYKTNHFLKTSGFFNLTSGGHINTFSVFSERCWRLLNQEGKCGMVLPTGVVMNYYMQEFFKKLIQTNSIICMFDFINTKKIFNIHSSFRFCLLGLSGGSLERIIPMTFYRENPIEIQNLLASTHLDKNIIKKLPMNHYLIPFIKDDFKSMNPNTETCLSVRNRNDLILLRKLYNEGNILIKRNLKTEKIVENIWNVKLKRLFDSSGDSKIFKNIIELRNLNYSPQDKRSLGGCWIKKNNEILLPLYEGRMIWLYDHRYNSVEFAEKGLKRKAKSRKTTLQEYQNVYYWAIPNYWVQKKEIEKKLKKNENKNWFLIYRLITGTTNERTFIISIVPLSGIARNTPRIITKRSPEDLCLLYANLASMVLDFICRLKLSSNALTHFVIEQLPVLSPEKFNQKLKNMIINNVLKLTYNSYSLQNFAIDVGYNGEPFKWDAEERMILQTELDAIYAHLYNISKDDLIYILETFPLKKKKDIKEFNEYKTKRLVLEAYDKFSKQKELFE